MRPSGRGILKVTTAQANTYKTKHKQKPSPRSLPELEVTRTTQHIRATELLGRRHPPDKRPYRFHGHHFHSKNDELYNSEGGEGHRARSGSEQTKTARAGKLLGYRRDRTIHSSDRDENDGRIQCYRRYPYLISHNGETFSIVIIATIIPVLKDPLRGDGGA